MKIRLAGAVAAVASLVVLASGAPAPAASSEWMTPSEASRFARSLDGGTALFGVQCKDSGKAGKVNDMALVKFTYRPNTKAELNWSWGVGDRSWFTKTSAARAAEGYKRVSYGSFTRKASGFMVQCAIWHK